MRSGVGKALRGSRGRAASAPIAEAVVSGRRLSRTQRERLAEAQALASGGLSERRRASVIIRDVERELAAARTSEAVEAGIEDTLARARKRGEVIEVETVEVGAWRMNEDGSMTRRNGQIVLDVQTVRRASRIDGLASLYKAGSINDRTKRSGDAFRVLWGRAQPPMAVSDYAPKAGGGRCDPGQMLVQVALSGSAGAVISEIGQRLDDRSFQVLNAVAGRGQTIRSLGDGGDLKVANRERLVAALGVVEQVLSEPKWRGLATQAR